MYKFSTFVFWLCLAMVGASLGCDETKAQPDVINPRNDQFLVRSFTLKGTTAIPAQVTVNGRPDADGIADTSWQAEFTLDGASEPGSLPVDKGYAQTHTATVEMKTSDGKTSTKKVTITLHE